MVINNNKPSRRLGNQPYRCFVARFRVKHLNVAVFFLERLQKLLDNQYYLVFRATPQKKDGLQRVNLSTEVPDVEIAAADNVWVPAAK